MCGMAAWVPCPVIVTLKMSSQAITASGLTWTIVRPPKLADHDAIGKCRAGTDLPIRLWSSVGRADLAAFLVDEAEVPRYPHAYPRITR